MDIRTSVGRERGAEDVAVVNQKPEFRGVATRAGDPRIGVGSFQRAEIGRQWPDAGFVKVGDRCSHRFFQS